MKRGPWIFKKVLMVLLFGTAAIFLFGFIVMSLWNAILPAVLHVGVISFWQALGILILCKILFGGFHGGRGRAWGGKMRGNMREKWMNMSDQEREQFKQQWNNRCAGWRRPSSENVSSSGEGSSNE
jgi:hypothetical protein